MKEHALVGVVAVLRAVNANALMEGYCCSAFGARLGLWLRALSPRHFLEAKKAPDTAASERCVSF